jgi:phenol hydroxylase P5 protein
MNCQMTIEPIRATIEVDEGQTLLDAALRKGVYLPYACGHGLCGSCKIEVLEGEVDQGDASPFALMDLERSEGKCLACCATPLSDIVVEADIEEDPDARSIPVCNFTGRVVRIDTFSDRIIGIFLELDQAIDFQAGQYVNVTVPGIEGTRAFSISNPPSRNRQVELNVCLVKDGAATTWLHKRLKVGDELPLSGPYGRFFVRKSRPEPMLFLAGGSGLSSPKSMILDLLEEGDAREITLIYGARNQDDLYYRELFDGLAKKHANFSYVPVLSHEPGGSGWRGMRGFVHELAREKFNGRFSGMNAYLCGPPPMVDACITTLMRGRLFEKNIFAENFFDQSARANQARSPLFKAI